MTGLREKDLFAVLGLPRRHDLAQEELERRFHERSRAVHPDRFARAAPAERRAALERTTHLNHAYRTLRDPWRRAEHLVALLWGAEPAGAPPPEDPSFLEEQLLAREALAAARRRREAAAIETIRTQATEALSILERHLGELLSGEAPGSAALEEATRLLGRVRYHRAVIDEAERALDHVPRAGMA